MGFEHRSSLSCIVRQPAKLRVRRTKFMPPRVSAGEAVVAVPSRTPVAWTRKERPSKFF